MIACEDHDYDHHRTTGCRESEQEHKLKAATVLRLKVQHRLEEAELKCFLHGGGRA